MDAVIEALAFGVRTTIFLFVMLFRALSMLIGGGIGVASKASETDVQKQIRTKKPPYYFDHQISAVSCPKCKTENEDVQDRCYRCGQALTGQAVSGVGIKTSTRIPAWAIGILVFMGAFFAVCCLCPLLSTLFSGSRGVSVYTPGSSRLTPNRKVTATAAANQTVVSRGVLPTVTPTSTSAPRPPTATPTYTPTPLLSEESIEIALDEEISETINFDMFDPSDDMLIGPFTSSAILNEGKSYSVTISGTYSLWWPYRWTSVCKGTPEEEPQKPSPDVRNGKVGIDPMYVFAVPARSGLCSQDQDTPVLLPDLLEISLDEGQTWFETPLEALYNPEHVYTFLIEGQNSHFQIRKTYSDRCCTKDNYGVVTIHVEGPVENK